MITVKQASQALNISLRGIQKKCKKEGLKKGSHGYIIPQSVFNRWVNERTLREKDAINKTITEEFNLEEYDKLNEVILKYPELLKRIEEYQSEISFLRDELKNRSRQLDEKSQQLDKIIEGLNGSIKALQQSNLLQASDKFK